MITPYFWLDQDSNFVYLHMRCPLLRAQDVEYTIEPSQFYFYCQPYFLRYYNYKIDNLIYMLNSELFLLDSPLQVD